MKLPAWRSGSITTRLVMVAIVPATLMFLGISTALYFSNQDEIRRDIEERGNVLAAALAESSQYAVVSGNTAPLKETFNGLLSVDSSLISIQIVDASRSPLVSVGDVATGGVDLLTFERPLSRQVPDVDLFGRLDGPHTSSQDEPPTQFRRSAPAGYVRVVMSPAPVLQAKRERLYLNLALVLIAASLSVIAGLVLARRLRDPLASVMTALRRIREGNFDVKLTPQGSGEMGELQAAIVEMAKELNVQRRDLEQLVSARTKDLHAAMESLHRADEDRRRLIAQGNALLEDERKRIANEIHDDLSASLIALQLESDQIASLIKRMDPSETSNEITEIAKRISGMSASVYTSARGIIKQLRPEVIDTLGLKGALQELVRTYDLAHPECEFSFHTEGDFPRIGPELSIAVYRVVQEALANVVKHASASHADVELHSEFGAHRITISDDGKGFNTKQPPFEGIGLISMRERMDAAGGSIRVESAPGSGTKVVICLPATPPDAIGGSDRTGSNEGSDERGENGVPNV